MSTYLQNLSKSFQGTFLNLLAEEAESPAGVLPLVEVVVLEDVGDVLGAAGGGRLGEGVRAHSGAPKMKH